VRLVECIVAAVYRADLDNVCDESERIELRQPRIIEPD